LLLFGGVVVLAARGVLAHTVLMQQDSLALQNWAAAGVGLLSAIVPPTVLVERFVALLQSFIRAERVARERLEAETQEKQLLQLALAESSERERQSLGRELHDSVCQQITAALLCCRVMQRVQRNQPDSEAAHLETIMGLLDDALSEAHDLARGLSPGNEHPGQLGNALRELARQVRETHEVACDVQDDGSGAGLPPDVAIQLYRIAQEAVLNALKHAAPGHVSIRLARDAGGLRLEVENDGRVLQTPVVPGRGVRIMRGRAERVGAALSVEPRTGTGVGGAVVRCVVPVSAKGSA
jgi:signal transduction histidine kinase